MKVVAPGKVVVNGAYAVLEGAPAIVLATSRGAVADSARSGAGTPEVRAALGEGPFPHVDASALFDGDRKLGLGASAAILVASMAVREAERGADVASAPVRARLLEKARAAHADAQAGGSGVDVAASVYGGALRYRMGETPERIALPSGVVVRIFACGTSARTSELRAVVAKLSVNAPDVYSARMAALHEAAHAASAAIARADRSAWIASIAAGASALDALGRSAGAPIVPAGFSALAAEASDEGAAFCVAGAGSGDVAVYVGSHAPSPRFLASARALGLRLLEVDLDEKGVRVVTSASFDAFDAAAPTRT